MSTNANSIKIAAIVSDADASALSELIVRKKGTLRGRGVNRKIYGDDLVKVQLTTGFSYKEALKQSLDELGQLTPEKIVVEAANRGYVSKLGKPVTTKEAETALQQVRTSLEASLTGTNVSTTEGVFEPLVVDDDRITGARVYTGPKEGQRKATMTPVGTIYLQGLKLSESVLQPAKYGPVPAPKSTGVVLAKRVIRDHILLGSYVSYTLAPNQPFILRLGGTSPLSSTGSGIRIRDAFPGEIFPGLKSRR